LEDHSDQLCHVIFTKFFNGFAGWEVHCGFMSSYNVPNISYLNSPFPPLSFILPTAPLFLKVSAGIVFAFTYLCTQFLHCIHPPTPFPRHLPLIPPPCPLPGSICSALLFSDFVKENRNKEKKRKLFPIILELRV
jgi:hypothetical protein